ncbi:MAG: hypothetical protein IJF68_03545, partial [Opitutales bacterium]|nr:hypothetical protein [Opitutales bacterium]
VRLSIGGDQVSRELKFDGSATDIGLRYFSMIDVASNADRICIEILNTQGLVPSVGIMEIEIRPTFSNADFSRMFGEFLSVLSEK